MTFREKLEKELVLLDGAFGTYSQSLGLSEKHFKDRPGCLEYLSAASPDLVARVHGDYFKAGADAVETNTFGGNALKLDEYGLGEDVYDINLASTRIARTVADEHSTAASGKYVIGSMGPTGKLPSSTDPALGSVTYRELKKVFREQALAIIDGGADALLVETGQDLLEMKAAVNGAKEAINERKKDIVVMAQCTLANNGRMLLGTEVSAVMGVMGYLGADVIGLNCSTGPVEMEGAVKVLSEKCPAFVSIVPNAGLPVEVGGETVYPMKPGEMARLMAEFVRKYRIDVIGGCCGTGPEHIRKIREAVGAGGKRPAPANTFYASFYRGSDLADAPRPIKIGERINTQGSRKMKELLISEDYDGIVELGKAQQVAGADVLDVCSVLTERRTEERDSVILTKALGESVEVPLMIDSTDADVIESALGSYPGTAFINSVNLEDGGEKARRVFGLAREHGGFVVNLAIDEKGMGRAVGRKLDIAERLYRMATEEFGIEGHRLLFDMLTFTLGTGEEEYRNAAVDTCEAIKRFKKKFPGALTVLGVSNVSFGLPREARKVLNMVFLHHAVKAGLDAAIVDPSEYTEYEDLGKTERKLSEDLIFNRHPDALARVIEHFEKAAPAVKKTMPPAEEHLTAEEKLKKCVLERDKSGITAAVDEALGSYSAEQIINDILMDTMREVGEKLDSGEMVLPYVLQSAEVMRKAIERLEKYLPKNARGARGKVLLATVFGDVHDIGKNLVKMILANNGFDVIDLGKQVPIDKIISEAKRNGVDAVGLSALLVSTARHMKTCVQQMHEAGLKYPVLIGGAPTNEGFAKDISLLEDKSVYKGGVFYSRDAFTGLKIMQALMDPDKRKEALEAYFGRFEEKEIPPERPAEKKVPPREKRKTDSIPAAPFFGARPLINISADEVFKYLDERMLFDLAWGAKLKDEKEKKRIINREYRPLLKELKEAAIRKGWLDLKAVYGYFKCRTEGDELEVLDDSGEVLERIYFSRSGSAKALALTDYFAEGPDGHDIVAFQAVTVGDKINAAIAEFAEAKEETRAYFLHGFSVHLAEALAAYVHGLIRRELKLGEGQGKRYSPGYPLWKNIRDQKIIFRLLEVERYIGVELTEGYQMVPEQSTTAMVIYNDQAEY